MLVSTFEVLVKPQLPSVPGVTANLSRNVIQGYFLTIANVNFFPVTLSVVFTIKFPQDLTPELTPTTDEFPKNFDDFLSVVDISGTNLLPSDPRAPKLVPEFVPSTNKARLTFTLAENSTGLLLLQANILNRDILAGANFEARGYVEIFLSSLSGSDTATLIVTPEQRGTFYKNSDSETVAEVGLDQIAYALPISNGGVFKLSNS